MCVRWLVGLNVSVITLFLREARGLCAILFGIDEVWSQRLHSAHPKILKGHFEIKTFLMVHRLPSAHSEI